MAAQRGDRQVAFNDKKIREMDSNKKTARIAGLLYLIMAILGGVGILYIPSQIIVAGDAGATSRNIIANEFLFRTSVVCELVSTILFLFLVFVLYRLLKPVNEHKAKLMVALVLVQVPIGYLIEALNITSLMIVKGKIMNTLPPEQKQDLVMLFLAIHRYGIITLEIFWGLWLIPFGQLVYKSGFIPRIFGVMLFIGGIGYMIESFTFLLFPRYQTFVSQFTIVTYSVAEISTLLWLLIIGAKNKPKFA
jgi:hypothetical protein